MSISFDKFWAFYEILIRSFHEERIINRTEFLLNAKNIKEKAFSEYCKGEMVYPIRMEPSGFCVSDDYVKINDGEINIGLNLEGKDDSRDWEYNTIENLVRLFNMGNKKVRKMIVRAAEVSKLNFKHLEYIANNTCLRSVDYFTCHLWITVQLNR